MGESSDTSHHEPQNPSIQHHRSPNRQRSKSPQTLTRDITKPAYNLSDFPPLRSPPAKIGIEKKQIGHSGMLKPPDEGGPLKSL